MTSHQLEVASALEHVKGLLRLICKQPGGFGGLEPVSRTSPEQGLVLGQGQGLGGLHKKLVAIGLMVNQVQTNVWDLTAAAGMLDVCQLLLFLAAQESVSST